MDRKKNKYRTRTTLGSKMSSIQKLHRRTSTQMHHSKKYVGYIDYSGFDRQISINIIHRDISTKLRELSISIPRGNTSIFVQKSVFWSYPRDSLVFL